MTLRQTTDRIRKQIAMDVRQARWAVKMNLDQLSEASGVSKSALSKIENGKSNVTMESLVKVFHALKYNIKFRLHE